MRIVPGVLFRDAVVAVLSIILAASRLLLTRDEARRRIAVNASANPASHGSGGPELGVEQQNRWFQHLASIIGLPSDRCIYATRPG